MNLPQLIHPLPLAEFFHKFLQPRIPLHLTERLPYSNLLSISDIDALFYMSRPDLYDVRASREGQPRILWHEDPGDNTVRVQVQQAYAQGHTINVIRLERYWPAVGRLCAAIAENLGHPTAAEMFLTPPGIRGLAPHWDPTDSFILQLEGRKRWRLHAAQRPIPQSSGEPTEPPGEPILEAVLAPGDFLYVPWGVIHDVSPLDEEPTLHVAVDIFPHTAASRTAETLRAMNDFPEPSEDALLDAIELLARRV